MIAFPLMTMAVVRFMSLELPTMAMISGKLPIAAYHAPSYNVERATHVAMMCQHDKAIPAVNVSQAAEDIKEDLQTRPAAWNPGGGWAAAQRARREEDAKMYRERAAMYEAAKQKRAAETATQSKVRKASMEAHSAKIAAYNDRAVFEAFRGGGFDIPLDTDLNVLPSPPSAKLTREAIQNSQKVASRAIDASERLVATCTTIGTMASIEAADTLSLRLDEARAAGVRSELPSFRKAVALLAILQSQAEAERERGDGMVPVDPLAAKMDAIFGQGYALPEQDPVEKLPWD